MSRCSLFGFWAANGSRWPPKTYQDDFFISWHNKNDELQENTLAGITQKITRNYIRVYTIHLAELGPTAYSILTKNPNKHETLSQCWCIVYDAGPKLTQQWFNVSCLLGSWGANDIYLFTLAGCLPVGRLINRIKEYIRSQGVGSASAQRQ